MKKVILSVVITIVVLIGLFVIFIYSGAYNVSQQVHHNALTQWAINTTVERSIESRTEDIKVPPMNDTAMLQEGFSHYNEMCVTCHGGPGIQTDDLAKGLYPEPPKFYKSNDMPDTTEAFWIIKNGIKYTSMPGFGPTHSDQKIWAITDFLLNKLNKMTPQEYQQWKEKYAQGD